MRQLLLDTHTALWTLSMPDRLDPLVRDAIEDPRSVVAVSSASVWEVEINRALGKLTAPARFGGTCIERGFDALTISFEHAEAATGLPAHHSDPFDRMLIAQAIAEELELVSDDRAFARYDVQVVRVARENVTFDPARCDGSGGKGGVVDPAAVEAERHPLREMDPRNRIGAWR